ncbi:unnamed protein product [Didymodactylos carnosus]|uniref:Protein YIPF3 n=1 Tax=Didymodactylos carnosus TaxID=1234261 RepID=A0A8S2FFT0_9BILA|nr:unnamed protein product [Didymodactylos carnosus]CAF4247441.1 unnamed protein product [Didymodactylos carnosus]
MAQQDGTLIGTAFFICFGYWIGSSFAISSVSFICNTRLSITQILSLNGYALFSHCVVLLFATFIHTKHDHMLFYLLWFFISGMAATKMASVVAARTLNPRYQLALAGFVACVHMVFLLYLHFAYHELAENIAHALQDIETNTIAAVVPLVQRAHLNIPSVSSKLHQLSTSLQKRTKIYEVSGQLLNEFDNIYHILDSAYSADFID